MDAGTTREGLAKIHDQVLWNRLISVVEEQAQALVRTAFSTSVRESGRPLGRRVRPPRPHGGAGGDRHARPRQLDGQRRRPLPQEVPDRRHGARRPLHHQRPVADLGPSARRDGGLADLPPRPRGRAVRLHDPRGRHRRARLRPGRQAGVRGGHRDPDPAARQARRAERDAARGDPRERARARPGGRRHHRLRHLERRGQPRAGRAARGVRPRRHRGAVRLRHRHLARGDARARSARCRPAPTATACGSTATRSRSTWSRR